MRYNLITVAVNMKWCACALSDMWKEGDSTERIRRLTDIIYVLEISIQ
jgi:hypothetical protein